MLEAADITPDRMRKALHESKRAEPKEISTLQWARERLWAGPGKSFLQAPPSPIKTFAFLLVWEGLERTACIAARQEMSRNAESS